MKWYEVIQELGGGEEVILHSTTKEADARRWLEEAGNDDNDLYIMQWGEAIEDCYVLD